MSVDIEREPAIEPIRKIKVSCETFPKDTLTIYFYEQGGASAEISLHRGDIEVAVDISSDDLDTLLQAFAEIRRDVATSPF